MAKPPPGMEPGSNRAVFGGDHRHTGGLILLDGLRRIGNPVASWDAFAAAEFRLWTLFLWGTPSPGFANGAEEPALLRARQ